MPATPTTYRESLNDAHADAEPWLEESRRISFERFSTLGFPAAGSEAWRNMPLEKVLAASFGESPVSYVCEGRKADGVYAGPFSGAPERVKTLLKVQLAKAAREESNAFAVINAFRFEQGFAVLVPSGQTEHLTIRYHSAGRPKGEPRHSAGSGGVFYPRIFVHVEKNARVLIQLEEETAAGQFADGVFEAVLESGAWLRMLKVRRGGGTAFLAARHRLLAGSRLQVLDWQEGQGVARTDNEVVLEEAGAQAELRSLAVLSGDAQVFWHGRVRHDAPDCRSDQYHKAVLGGRARSEFHSLVWVPAGSSGSDSRQLNKNLLLSESARAWSRPELRILNDDVSCFHGSATGKLEDDELFYLRSRGLDDAAARRLLVEGFAREVLEKVDAPIRVLAEKRLERVLAGLKGERWC